MASDMRFDDRYRTAPEPRIRKMLALSGWTYEKDPRLAEDGAAAVIQRWVELGLPFRTTSDGQRLFNPVEVTNFFKRLSLDGRDDFLAERFVPNHQRMVTELAEAASNEADGSCRLTIDFKRTFNLRSIAPGKKLRLRAPLPLEGNCLKEMEITPSVDSAAKSEIILSPGRFEARTTCAGQDEVTLRAVMKVKVAPQEPHPGDADGAPDRELYLNEREGLIVVSERVRALARSLAAPGAPVIEALRAFWEFTNEELLFGSLHYDQIDLAAPCDWVLDTGWYDCQLGGSLFVALCRASGIPARLVSGYLLYLPAPLRHYWAEAWIDGQGWTPFDLISWDISFGGRDKAWRDRYFGRVDYRLICERLPREFTGTLGVPIPPAWWLLTEREEGGIRGAFMNIEGSAVYTDTICITT